MERKCTAEVLVKREDSNLQVSLGNISQTITNIATISAILIVLIMWLRVTIELAIISSQQKPDVDSDWWLSVVKLYVNSETKQFTVDVVKFYFQGLLLLFTIMVVAIPEGLLISGYMSMALSIRKLIEAGIYVKNVYALESIGNLDLLVFDYTRGFTLNEINFEKCMFEDDKS